MIKYEAQATGTETGPSFELVTTGLNLHIPGSTLVVTGTVKRDFSGAPAPDQLKLQLRDAGGVTQAERLFNFSDIGGDLACTGVFCIFTGFLDIDTPLWSAYRVFLEDSTGAASDLTYDLKLVNTIGSLLPNSLFPDLNLPPESFTDTPAMVGVGTSITGGMNVHLDVPTLQGTILGQPTTGRFKSWVVDLSVSATTPGPSLQNLSLNLYLIDGSAKRIYLQDIQLGPAIQRRTFFTFFELSSAYVSFLDLVGICSDASVAADIRSGALPLDLTIQPLNYERQ